MMDIAMVLQLIFLFQYTVFLQCELVSRLMFWTNSVIGIPLFLNQNYIERLKIFDPKGKRTIFKY